VAEQKMNERIRELETQSYTEVMHEMGGTYMAFDKEKFAELIVRESCQALNPMLRDMISRGHGVDIIKRHFEIE
jgi:hypothetical protein